MVCVAVLAIPLGLVATPASAEGRWQKTENQPECEVWNASPSPEESVTWSGLCVNGRAEAAGELVWRYLADGVLAESVYAGSMKGGKTGTKTAKEFTFGPAAIGTKALGATAKSMDLVSRLGQVAHDTKGSGRMKRPRRREISGSGRISFRWDLVHLAVLITVSRKHWEKLSQTAGSR
jgi:hypothetical protein